MSELAAGIVERGELADVLRGKGRPPSPIVPTQDGRLPIKLRSGQVGVSFAKGKGNSLPCMLIVREGELQDLFAWVNTYCPFVTPLSRWCRVVEEVELKRMGAAERTPEFGNATAAWAGAIIGEALLRLGGRMGALHVSVAALQSCATFVAARAFGLWGNTGMRKASASYEEARQLLGPTSLRSGFSGYDVVWNVLAGLDSEVVGTSRTASSSWASELAIECCRDIQRNGFVEKKNLSKATDALGWPGEFDEYEDSAAEQRLEMYDLAMANLAESRRTAKENVDPLADLIVAYFAAKISASISGHIQLIQGLQSSRPMTMMWYGIVSALHQPEIWGTEFNGLARLATRELEFPIRLDEAPRSDVSLAELRTLVEPSETYSKLGFRGASSRVLSVELALGVAGVIRLIDGGEEYQKSSRVPANEEVRWRLQQVVDTLRSATEEARRAQEVLEEAESSQRPISSHSDQASREEIKDRRRRKGRAKGSSPTGRYVGGKLLFDDP